MIRFGIILLCFAIGWVCPASAHSSVNHKNILVLNSYGPNVPWTRNVLAAYEATSKKHPEYRFYHEFIHFNNNEIDFDGFHIGLISKYDYRQFDAVIGHGRPIRRYLEQFAGDYAHMTKLMLTASFDSKPTDINFFSSVHLSDIRDTLSKIIRLHPDAKSFNIIYAPSIVQADYEQILVNIFAEHFAQLKLNLIKFESMSQYEAAVRNFANDSIVLYYPIRTEYEQAQLSGKDMLDRTMALTNAPIYSLWELFFDNGIIGGNMIVPSELVDNMITNLDIYFETGEFESSLAHGRWIFDYNKLEQYDIDHWLLPEGSQIINRPIPIWQQYPLELGIGGILICISIALFLNSRYLLAQRNVQIQSELTQTAQLAADEAKVALASRDRFLHAISHELRTPINGIVGAVEQFNHAPHKAQHFLDIINYCSHSLHNTVNDILDYAKFQTQSFSLANEAFNVASLVNDLHNYAVSISQHKDIHVECQHDIDPDLYINGDRFRIAQIANNLINNAIKFTNSGKITLTFHVEKYTQGVEFQCAVTDTGIGISKASQSKLFEPFSQVDDSITRKQTGTGLGLSICAMLLEKMQGHIEVKSIVGQGSTFYFQIPLSYPDASTPEQTVKPVDYALLSSLRILVVEDNSINQELVRMQLTKHCALCFFAANGQEALNILEHQPNFDLILMDLQMPIMDGYTTAKAIRDGKVGDSLRDIPIIALTAHMSLEPLKQQFSRFNCSLHKPFTQHQLHQCISDLLGSAQHLAERKFS